MRLLLFDIDGTLICSSRVGRKVVAQSLHKVFGSTGPIEQYSFAGKTDLAIIIDLMMADGFTESEVRLKLPFVYQYIKASGQRLFPGDGLRACPGIADLLNNLVMHESITLGLQTGNINSTAPLKLQAAGIDPRLFSIGAYGSDAFERVDLIPIAWARAERKTGLLFTGENTIVIGDTPADIECAKDNGATSVAVATGTYSAATLAQSEPAYLFDDLADIRLSLDTLVR